MGASRVPVVIVSMERSCLLSTVETSRTMPGWSLPSRSIVSWSVPAAPSPSPSSRSRLRTRVSRHLEQAVERAQRRRELLGAGLRHADDDDAGELARQLGELALLPVAVVLGDDVCEGADEAGAVVSDDGEHESGHVPILTTGAPPRPGKPRSQHPPAS